MTFDGKICCRLLLLAGDCRQGNKERQTMTLQKLLTSASIRNLRMTLRMTMKRETRAIPRKTDLSTAPLSWSLRHAT